MSLNSKDLQRFIGNINTSPSGIGHPASSSNPSRKINLELSDLPAYKNALLLQGPVGPFFLKLSQFLNQRGTKTYKINFNPGDEWFYPDKEPNTSLYDFTLDYWPQYLERFILQNHIQTLFLFGDCRPIHLPARVLCKKYGIDLWVFEEGYYRPHFYTLEFFGVNANSTMHESSLESLLMLDAFVEGKNTAEAPIEYNSSQFYITRYAIIYWLINILRPFKCANYDHHRKLNFLIAYRWIKNFFSLWIHKIKDRAMLKKLLHSRTKQEKNYFLFPLQVHDDSQITQHSDFESIEQVIELVITSFYKYLALNKDSTAKLVIKHHPMDRGHKNYSEYIQTLTRTLGISKSVYYLHELDLNLIFPQCKGCITVNSTLGLKALEYGIPVKNLGRSFYDKLGITSQSTLEKFWASPEPVSQPVIQQFRRIVLKKTQINGCLYSPEYKLK